MEVTRKAEKPIVSGERAVELARELYGLHAVAGSVKDLDSYDDRNFYMKATHARPELVDAGDANEVFADAPSGGGSSDGRYHFVLKIHNGVESLDPAFIECQNLAMEAVRSGAGVWCPRALPAVGGATIARARSALASGSQRDHAVRCLPFRPGGLLADVPLSPALLRKLGAVTARVSASLAGFAHPAAHRTAFIWDLANAPSVRALLEHSPAERHAALTAVLDEFDAVVAPRAEKLRSGTVHGDLNDQNVLVDALGEEGLGIIDFGDMAHSWLVNEIAIATAYVLIALHYGASEPAPGERAAGADGTGAADGAGGALSELEAAVAMTSSYAAEMAARGMPLSAAEWAVLPTLIACRITVSLVIGAFSSAQDPTNEYLKLTLLPGWTALQRLRATPAAEMAEALRSAAAASVV